MALYGALIGDYYGSYWEFLPKKPESYDDALSIRKKQHFYTDDTFMTLAIANAFMQKGDLSENAVKQMRNIGNAHWGSYGGSFARWLRLDNPQPYYSWGNGGSMRVSSAGLIAESVDEAIKNADAVTKVTHDHPYGLYFAEVTAALVYLAKTTDDKHVFAEYLTKEHKSLWRYVNNMSLGQLHKEYTFNETSQDTVPQAIYCFLSSQSFEDCLARCLYIGGDSDTLAAIACSIAAPFYGDGEVRKFVSRLPKLPKDLKRIMKVFTKNHLC